MPQGRRACLAIGISDAGGGLDYLGGALNGARGVHQWAQALGYESRLLVDEDTTRIHVDTVRDALLALLPRGSATERLVLYFAGHGFIAQGDNGLWLLNDWKQQRRAVAVELLRRNLREYGVEQIAIMADACRQLPPDIQVATLTQDGVLGAGFTAPRADPLIDRFTATQDGRAAYMIPGRTAQEEDRCIFSGVLLEGLWGASERAFSKRSKGQVISSSLADFLRTRVPEVAGQYRLEMTPQAFPGFPELADVYFDREQKPPPAVPVLPPWPAPPGSLALDAPVAQGRVFAERSAKLGELLKGVVGVSSGASLGTDLFKTITLGTVGTLGSVLGKMLPPFGRMKRRRAGPRRPDGLSDEAWEAVKATVLLKSDAPLGADARRQLEWLAARGSSLDAAKKAQARRRGEHDETLRLARAARVPDGLRQGLVTTGEVRRIWAPPGLVVRRLGADPAWAVDGTDADGQQLLVEFDGGGFGACVMMDQMVVRMGHDDEGVRALTLQPGYGGREDMVRNLASTEQAIARLGSGMLDIPDATDLATDLRVLEHIDPVLGVICAYLYDAIGDRDSIRRMACLYVRHGQAIPYDIAFLADLETRPHADGRLRATVPALPQRKPRTAHEGGFPWTTTETAAVEGTIGGRVFWLRQGWPFMASASAAESAMSAGIANLIDGLRPSLFTTLDEAAGKRLISLLRLETRP